MLKTSEAIYENGQVKWLTEALQVKSARVIVTVLEEIQALPKLRTPSTKIAGKSKMISDLISPIVDEQDWECRK